MRKPRQPVAFAQSVVSLTLTIAAWIIFAPGVFGGGAAYVIVNGNSMEPDFVRGDLVILRQTGDYEVGDVVTYQMPSLGAVIHRIIARDGARYVLKGDNNSWIDSYHPVEDDVLGEAWIHIPQGGKYIAWLRSPLVLTVVAAATAGIMFLNRGNDMYKQLVLDTSDTQSQPGVTKTDVLVILIVALLGSVALGIVAFNEPVTETKPHEISYTHGGSFSYATTVAPGVYDSTTVQTGDPIFRELADHVLVTFDYQLSSEAEVQIQSSARLLALVKDETGWSRTLELQPTRPFTGTSVALSGELSLAQLQGIIEELEVRTGVERREYTVSIVPEVSVNGAVDGQPLQDTYTTSLDFLMTETQMWLFDRDERGVDTITRLEEKALVQMRPEPNTLKLLGFTLDVRAVRQVAPVTAMVALGGLVIMGVLSLHGRGREAAQASASPTRSKRNERRSAPAQPMPQAAYQAQPESMVQVEADSRTETQPAVAVRQSVTVAPRMDQSFEDDWTPPPPPRKPVLQHEARIEDGGLPLSEAWRRAARARQAKRGIDLLASSLLSEGGD